MRFVPSVLVAFTLLFATTATSAESHTVRVNYSLNHDGSFDLAVRHTQSVDAAPWDAMKVTLLPSGRVLASAVASESPIAETLAGQLRTDTVEPVVTNLNDYSVLVTSAEPAAGNDRVNVTFFIGGKEEAISDARVPFDRDFWFQTMREDVPEEVAQFRFDTAPVSLARSRAVQSAGNRTQSTDNSVVRAGTGKQQDGELRTQFCGPPRFLHCGSCDGCYEQCVCCSCAWFHLNCLDCTITCNCG